MAAHCAIKSEKLALKENMEENCPDTLQDLCTFYLMNNIDTLATSLKRLNTVNTDLTSVFALVLSNKLLEYYLRCCVPHEKDLQYLDEVFERSHFTDEVNILRSDILLERNVVNLARACKSIRKLHITCFDEDSYYTNKFFAYKFLIENSLPHLTSLSLSQKCEENEAIGLLNIVCGRDYDAGVEELYSDKSDSCDGELVSENDYQDDGSGKDEDENQKPASDDNDGKPASNDSDRKSSSDDNDGKSASDDSDGKSASDDGEGKSASNDNDGKSASDDNDGKSASDDSDGKSASDDGDGKSASDDNDRKPSNSDDDGKLANDDKIKKHADDDTGKLEDTSTVENIDLCEQTSGVITDLKSFSYQQVYTNAHPNLCPCIYFGWFYELMSRIINCNKNLRSFTLVTLISNPIEWFLSRPELEELKYLQSLSLSFQYARDYSAESFDVKMPKMPYNERFFENLPLLQQLRHLDVSCNIPDEEVEEDTPFAYCDRDVELFREAIKKMPQLKSLDISGSNLSTIICHKNNWEKECSEHCMPGFEGRRFDFLGLYGTDACKHKFIPADRVSGNASIQQLLAALQTLQHNLLIIPMVAEEISEWVKAHSVDVITSLALIDAFISYFVKLGEWNGDYSESQTGEERTLACAVESILVLSSQDHVKVHMTVRRRRIMLEQLLVLCYNVSKQRRMMAHKYKIYNDCMMIIARQELQSIAVISYRLKQYIQVLTGIFDSMIRPDDMIPCLRLIDSACMVSQEYCPVALTQVELVKKLLKIVVSEIIVREFAWKVIVTLTDGVLPNCEAFIQSGGLVTSIGFINGSKTEMFQEILATLVNLTKQPSLITFLMRSELLTLCKKLCQREDEIRSPAVEFLVMLASHGPEAWTVTEPSRDNVLEEIDGVMKTWQMSFRDVSRRSFTAILSQLQCYCSPVVQIWTAQKIYNLLSQSPHPYFDMLKSENGMIKIDTVLQHQGLRDDLVALLEKIKAITMDNRK